MLTRALAEVVTHPSHVQCLSKILQFLPQLTIQFSCLQIDIFLSTDLHNNLNSLPTSQHQALLMSFFKKPSALLPCKLRRNHCESLSKSLPASCLFPTHILACCVTRKNDCQLLSPIQIPSTSKALWRVMLHSLLEGQHLLPSNKLFSQDRLFPLYLSYTRPSATAITFPATATSATPLLLPTHVRKHTHP